MASTPDIPNPPDPRRIITDTTANGTSIFSASHSEQLAPANFLGGTNFRLAYVTPPAPPSLQDGADLTTYSDHLAGPSQLVLPGGGATVWYVDTPPGGESPMHRTVSLDLVVLLQGELELELDGGETRVLRPGDTVVQRGTMHRWRNRSATEWTRMLAVMTESRPLVVEGKELGMEFK